MALQASAEQPFDMSGLDDVFVDVSEEFQAVLGAHDTTPIMDAGTCFAKN
jgi:hypothetical protein